MKKQSTTSIEDEATTPAEPDVDVVLNREGVKACGEYLRGQVYTVPASEATRLVDHKGFEYVNKAEG